MQIRSRARIAVIAAAAAAMLSVPAAVAGSDPAGDGAADGLGPNGWCARDFEATQQLDMESFANFDAETFRAVHHPDAVTIFASGHRFEGIDAVMAALSSHFENKNATWTWDEVYRVVEGCRTGYILYETWYEIPSIGFSQHALTSVTYTRLRGEWLAVADQGTPLP